MQILFGGLDLSRIKLGGKEYLVMQMDAADAFDISQEPQAISGAAE